jgi:hypothetical protein
MIPMHDNSWQDLFKAALLEVDRAELRPKIEIAWAAIQERSEGLRLDGSEGGLAEAQQLTDALQTLRSLQRTELKEPCAVPGGMGLEGTPA